jgi:hypothetical protein
VARVIDRDRGYKGAVRRLLGLGNVGVSVGVHEDAGADEDGTPVAEYAMINEFGSEDGHVPERSFLRSTLDERQGPYAAELERAVSRAVDGVPLKTALMPLALQVRQDVQNKIDSGVNPENADSTVAKKGHGRTLEESGLLHDSIVAKVGSQR